MTVRAQRTLTLDTELGFVLRFTLLALASVALPWLVTPFVPDQGPTSWLVPGVVAGLIVVTYRWRPVEALLLLAVFILFYDTLAIQVGGSLTHTDELAVPLLVLISFARVARRWRDWVSWPRDVALVIAFVLGILSSLVAGVPAPIWLKGMVLVAKPIAFFYAVLWTGFRDWEIRGAMRVTLAIAFAVMALGFIELINPMGFQAFFELPFFRQPRTELPVVKSVLIHPALFGWFTTFVAIFAFAQYVVTRRLRWLFIGFFFALGPFLSARRRAILSLLGALVVGFSENLRRVRDRGQIARTWVPVAIGSLALFIMFLPGLTSLYAQMMYRYFNIATESLAPGETPIPIADPENPRARFALYQGSVKAALDYLPLGAGFGRYGSWVSRENYSPLYDKYGMSDIRGLSREKPMFITDTFWPQILGEMGVGGLVTYATFIGWMGVMLWREADRRDDGEFRRVFRFAAGMVFAQTIIESFASSMFHSPPRVYLVFLVIGAVGSMAWRIRAAEARDGPAEAAPATEPTAIGSG